MIHHKTKFPNAFTIVELLVVIVVIGILATITIVSYTGISNKAVEASVVLDLDNSSKLFKLFQIENSNYPDKIETNCIAPSVPTYKCIKLSSNNTLGVYNVNNTPGAQTFCLTVKNGTNIKKTIDQDGIITDNASCTYPFPGVPLLANSSAPTVNSIPLSWSSITGTIDSYILERDTDNDFTSGHPTTLTAPAPGVTAYTSSGLTSGTTYYYRMKVTMNGDTSNWSNTASNSTKANLAISAGANGSVNTAVNGVYTFGDTPTITATPNANYAFSSWSGTGCSGAASHVITMNSDKSCVANFILNPTLTITAGANGTVNTAVNGSYTLNATPTITATATPSPYYVFSSWAGSTGCSGTASHTITMDSNKSCTANFVLSPEWYVGGAGTSLAGKFVYYIDAPGTYTWSPNAGCVAGGRWPTAAELTEMAHAWYYSVAGRIYGTNYEYDWYWSSDVSSSNAYRVHFNVGVAYTAAKTYAHRIRCVGG